MDESREEGKVKPSLPESKPTQLPLSGSTARPGHTSTLLECGDFAMPMIISPIDSMAVLAGALPYQ
jgi:hypothetical protein